MRKAPFYLFTTGEIAASCRSHVIQYPCDEIGKNDGKNYDRDGQALAAYAYLPLLTFAQPWPKAMEEQDRQYEQPRDEEEEQYPSC